MFGSFFSSANQKLVKQWTKEHQLIVKSAGKIIQAYEDNNAKKIKKELISLRELALGHLMTEDLEFYKLKKETGKHTLDSQTEKLVNEFTNSFKETKLVLMNFLTKYTHSKANYDAEFFETFNVIVGVLGERIAFEEENLYVALNTK